jgi:putative glutamine amidotransferase
MDPATYGEEMTPLCGRIDPPRDQTELALARWAIEDGKPVLGVCRGLQVINVATGGTLYQDLATQYPGAIKHDYYPGHPRDYLAHDIRIEGRSRLHRSFGAEQVRVNSMHHQGIKTLGDTLVPTAWAPDGVIEAAESNEHPFLAGAQWHPEMLADTDAPTLRLFTAFADAAGAFHDGRRIAGPVAA